MFRIGQSLSLRSEYSSHCSWHSSAAMLHRDTEVVVVYFLKWDAARNEPCSTAPAAICRGTVDNADMSKPLLSSWDLKAGHSGLGDQGHALRVQVRVSGLIPATACRSS